MSAPTNFILGVKTFTALGNTYTGIVRVDFRDATPLSGEGYDDDTSDTQVWTGPHRGTGTVHLRDPATAQALKGVALVGSPSNTVVVVGRNRNTTTNSTHTFSSVVFAQPGGDMSGGAMAPESMSVNFRYGDLTITQAG